MDSALRTRFNRCWSPALFQRVRHDLERRVGCAIPFPIAETPIFLSAAQRERFTRAADEIVAQLSTDRFLERARAHLPAEYDVAGRGPLPHMAQIDFAVVREEDGSLGPRVVELQGFPSLYCFQILLADVWATHLVGLPDLPGQWRLFFSDYDRYRAHALLRETLLGPHEAEQVCLLDVDPAGQKTLPDFLATKRAFGIEPVCVTELVREGRRLFRVRDGRRVEVRRLYYRVVLDELEQAGHAFPVDLRADLEVEWVPHPAWWFLWSKSSLLHLDHPAVPKTIPLTEASGDPQGYVLKPLYSFAGGGVNVDPTRAALEEIPESQRADWILQEKVEYAPVFQTVDGDPVKVELRMMYVRPDGASEMTLLLNLVRLSRGKMMGVDYNKDLAWTGASVALFT